MQQTDEPARGSLLGSVFGVVVRLQTYLNLLYLFIAFPLGLAYFIFLVTGLSVGISLVIIWVGLPILLFMLAAWSVLAIFERQLVMLLLRVTIPPMTRRTPKEPGLWSRTKAYLGSGLTWKSLAYLFVEFPFGTVGFCVVVSALSIPLWGVSFPIWYRWTDNNLGSWKIDSFPESIIWLVPSLVAGFILLHLANGMAYLWGRFARAMLGGIAELPDADGAAPLAAEEPSGLTAGVIADIAELPDATGLPAETPTSSGPDSGVVAGAIAGAAVLVIGLGGAALYLRRRWRR